jgi:hypothetical protein
MFPEFRKQKIKLTETAILFVCCKRKPEMAIYRLLAANGNGKHNHGQQTINDNQRLLFQQTCPHLLGRAYAVEKLGCGAGSKRF